MFVEYNRLMKKIIIIILGLQMSILPSQICVGETFDNPTSPLIISEFLPNPKGADKGQEWVEIYNTTKQRISLGNWKLSNGKIFNIPEGLSVLPESYFVLQNENLKITLKNSNTFLSLIDPSDKTVQEIPYQKTFEGQSYSRTPIKTSSSTKYTWSWGDPTKGSKNNSLYLIQGEITKSPDIGQDFYFEISISKKPLQIIFSEEKFDFNLMKTTLTEKSKGAFLVEKSSNKASLVHFKITKPYMPETDSANSSDPTQKATTSKKHYLLLIPICFLTGALIYLSTKPPPL